MAWVCPYCRHSQILSGGPSEKNLASTWSTFIFIKENEFGRGDLGTSSTAIACLNCGRVTFRVALHLQSKTGSDKAEQLRSWSLLPESYAKPQPEYIPAAIRSDYEEACKIRDLSPKASATLARRCLQGMIRDFAKISRPRLIDELRELRLAIDENRVPQGVTPESVNGIDAVREIGNIGAHMEKDVDVIVDIEPGEAQILIELIETLFDEWYIARHARQERFARVATLSAEKKLALEKAKASRIEGEQGGTTEK